MKAASAESFYAFSVCLLPAICYSLFAIRAALLLIHDLPLHGDRRQIDGGNGLPVLKYPNEPSSIQGIFPNQTGLTCAHEIARTGYVPVCAHSPQIDRGSRRSVVHQPDGALAGHPIFPNQIRLPVAEKIRHPGDVPIWAKRLQPNGGNRHPIVHQPDLALARDAIFPDQVRLPVAVKVAGSHHMPTSTEGRKTDTILGNTIGSLNLGPGWVSDYNLFSGPTSEPHSIRNAPNPFRNSASFDYHLKPGSPAIDKGLALGPPYDVDPDGNARTPGRGGSIGAY
jgi:hypothetical protein